MLEAAEPELEPVPAAESLESPEPEVLLDEEEEKVNVEFERE